MDETRSRLDRWTVPSHSTAIRYGLISLGLIAFATLLEMSQHGLDVESWGAISGSAIVLVPAWAGLAMFTRYRRDRQIEFLLLAIGAWAWAIGQLLWIAQIALSRSEAWPSFRTSATSSSRSRRSPRSGDTRPFERWTRSRFHGRRTGAGRRLELHRMGVHHPSRRRRPSPGLLPPELAMLIYPLADSTRWHRCWGCCC